MDLSGKYKSFYRVDFHDSLLLPKRVSSASGQTEGELVKFSRRNPWHAPHKPSNKKFFTIPLETTPTQGDNAKKTKNKKKQKQKQKVLKGKTKNSRRTALGSLPVPFPPQVNKDLYSFPSMGRFVRMCFIAFQNIVDC